MNDNIYPESKLNGRTKLAFNWIPEESNVLLDGGCAYGYGTRFFKEKCKDIYGIDPNEEFISIAKKRYPGINFFKGGLENTPFEPNFFDVIIIADVLEHVKDQLQSLNEIFRILKPNGTLILTIPHKGLFSFMDPDNYIFYLRKYLPRFYKFIYRSWKGKDPQIRPGYEDKHYHYSTKDVINMLNSSKFENNYTIVKTFKSGLFMGSITSNLDFVLRQFIGNRLTSILLTPLTFLTEIDFWIPYGIFSSSLALKIIKN